MVTGHDERRPLQDPRAVGRLDHPRDRTVHGRNCQVDLRVLAPMCVLMVVGLVQVDEQQVRTVALDQVAGHGGHRVLARAVPPPVVRGKAPENRRLDFLEQTVRRVTAP